MASLFPRYIRAAIEAIDNHVYEPHLEYHLAAVIVVGGNIVSVGYNSSRSNSFIRAFGTQFNNMHAECNAILKARKKIDLTGSKLYVARRTLAKGVVANSQPCDMCLNAALLYGIKRIYYTVDERTHAVMRL